MTCMTQLGEEGAVGGGVWTREIYLVSTATVVFFFNDYWCEPRNAQMGTCSVFVVRSNVTTMREKECTSYKDE